MLEPGAPRRSEASTCRDRIIVRGRTKTEVKDKLRARHTELAAGVRTPRPLPRRAVPERLAGSLNTQAESTVTGYRIMARHLTGLIGKIKLADLKVRDVQFALGTLAERLSTRSVRLARMILIQAIRNAMVNDLVARNVADLAAVPIGKPGRPSRSFDLVPCWTQPGESACGRTSARACSAASVP